MNPPPINFRSLKRNQPVPTSGDVKINAVRETLWTSVDSRDTNLQSSFVVTGKLSDKGVSYPVAWKVGLEPGDLDKLTVALNELEGDVHQRNFTAFPSLELQAYIQATETLRIGYLSTKEETNIGMKYYADFSQGEQKLRAVFDTIEGLRNLHRSHL